MWDEAHSDMRVGWCSAVDAADAASATEAVGRTTVALEPDDPDN